MGEKVLDCVGREIKAGSTILYACRRGSRMWLARMNVTQVIPSEGKRDATVSGFNTDGRRVKIGNLANVVVIVPLGNQYEQAA